MLGVILDITCIDTGEINFEISLALIRVRFILGYHLLLYGRGEI